MTGRDESVPDARTASALADAARITGAPCGACGAALCGHEAVFSLVLGYKRAPRCLPCVAGHMREPVAELRDRALTYVLHHDCFLAAWDRASVLEGFDDARRPPCLWSKAPEPVVPTVEPTPAATGTTGDAVAVWDAGDMACGDLVLELRLRLRELRPGAVLEVIATDPGAPIDLPAWCALTGNPLVDAEHPRYRIRRKG